MLGQAQATMALQRASPAQGMEAESQGRARLPVEMCLWHGAEGKPGHHSCALLPEGFITLLGKVVVLGRVRL